ncbi:MAG: type II secretion system protein GspN [Deltaproteobacteria bacterium]|nr:type II secretion system protein GspN [Deltaproteobacteria bacterium]
MNVLKYIGFAAFFVVAFIVSLYLTFPWDAAKDFALQQASKATGMELHAKSLEPSWITGVVAKDLEIRTPSLEEPISLAEVKARGHILPLLTGGRGVTADLPIAQGTVHADVVDSSDRTQLEAELKGIQIALVPGLQDAIGVPLTGKLDLDADLDLDKAKPEASSGTIKIAGAGLELLKGGKVAGMTLPFELSIGDFSWTIPITEGKAKLDKLGIKGDSVELELDGTLTLNADLSRSVPNLVVKFKPTEAFLKKEPLLNALLANINRAKGSDGFYAYTLTGSLKHPRFAMRRGG